MNIQQELDHLEDMLLGSPNVPLTGFTMVNEEQILKQLDHIRMSLPTAFREAEDLLNRQQELIQRAEQQAQSIVNQARQQEAQLLNELGIIQRAEREAQQIRQQVQQEVRTIREKTTRELEQMRQQLTKDLEDKQRQTLGECHALQSGAEDYAERVLAQLEQDLTNMVRVARNGRQQLRKENATKTTGPAPVPRESPLVPRSGGPALPGRS